MINIAVSARPVLRIASVRKPATLAPVLDAMVWAFHTLRERHLHSIPTEAVRRPIVRTFIVYDVLDVIGGGRGVNSTGNG